MRHVLFGGKSVFVGDEAADVLVDFGAHVAQVRTGARVDLRCYSSEGNQVITTFLLNSGSNLVAESATADMVEPDNAAVISYMRERMQAFSLDAAFFDGFRVERPTAD